MPKDTDHCSLVVDTEFFKSTDVNRRLLASGTAVMAVSYSIDREIGLGVSA